MKLRYFGIFLAALIMFASPAYALDLHSARTSGLVGEGLDGYVVARKDTAEVKALVSEVNTKRRQAYARISAENKQPVDIVAKLAAEQIINGLDSGVYYQTPGGWKQR